MRATIHFREDGCWEWESYRNPDGYARSRDWSGAPGRPAHRVIFEQVNGPVPVGLELDHLCRNRACVRPDHLEVVTRAEHARRHPSATKTACVNGHEYTPENTYLRPTGSRDCRTCIRERVAAYKARKAAA